VRKQEKLRILKKTTEEAKMAKMSIINRETVGRSIYKYTKLAVIGFLVYSALKFSNNLLEHRKYSGRYQTAKEFITQGKLEEAKLVLDSFSASNGLEKPDLEALGISLKSAKKEKAIKDLESAIVQKPVEEAAGILSKVYAQGVLNETQKSEYDNKIYSLSEAGLLESIVKSKESEKISLIEQFVKRYPLSESAPELKKQGIETCMNLAYTYIVDEKSQDLLNIINNMNNYLDISGKEIIGSINFAPLDSVKDYILNLPDESRDFDYGDRIRVKASLGPLFGRPKGEYAFGNAESDAPIGIGGIVIGFNATVKAPTCKLDNGREYNFISREIEKTGDNKSELTRILNVINEKIEAVYSGGLK
jgi:hypothetical protein